MNYDDMFAGVEMDRLVAERVMGWKEDAGRWVHKDTIKAWVYPWEPSTNIANAWEVVEKMRKNGYRPILIPDWGNHWQCLVYREAKGPLFIAPFTDSAPVAICRAALKAMEESCPMMN